MRAQDQAPTLSWVVPMFRTRDYLESLCARALAAAQSLQLTCEMVLVDDACPDGSASLAQQLAKTYPIQVVRLNNNQGQDAAILAGLRVCRGRWALILDGDLQDPPEALAALWPLTTEYDAVFAARFGNYESRARLISSRLYRRCMELAGGLPPRAGLFVLISRTLIERLGRARSSHPSILALIASARGRYISVPVERAARPAGRSSYGAGKRLRKGLLSLSQTVAARYFGMRL